MSEETLEISYDQVEKEREKYLLVDTRDKVTIEYGMIPGAISVPEPDLKERAEELKGEKIPVLYCTRGLFSQEGAQMLREKGIPALSLKGGYTGWLFEQMQNDMYARAKAFMDSHMTEARTYDEFKDAVANKPGFVEAMWCGDEACELKIKEDTTATSRCMPFAQEHLSDKCVCCGKPVKKMVYWGRAY